MECEEGQPREDVDTGAQAAPPFWQRIGPRTVALLALVGTAAAVFLTQHWHSRSEFRHKLTETQPTTGYAIETTATKAAPAVNRLVPEVSPTATAPIAVDMIASPQRSIADQPAALQLTTKPAGATFAVYPGIIADKAAPASAPLRTGTSSRYGRGSSRGKLHNFFSQGGLAGQPGRSRAASRRGSSGRVRVFPWRSYDHECSEWRGNSLRHYFAWVHALNGCFAGWQSSAHCPPQELSGPHPKCYG